MPTNKAQFNRRIMPEEMTGLQNLYFSREHVDFNRPMPCRNCKTKKHTTKVKSGRSTYWVCPECGHAAGLA